MVTYYPVRGGTSAPMPRSAVYAPVPCSSGRGYRFALYEAGPTEPAEPRLLDRVRAAVRLRHDSQRTEDVAAILRPLAGVPRLMASLLYGSPISPDISRASGRSTNATFIREPVGSNYL